MSLEQLYLTRSYETTRHKTCKCCSKQHLGKSAKQFDMAHEYRKC